MRPHHEKILDDTSSSSTENAIENITFPISLAMMFGVKGDGSWVDM
jgi:hypothetical protein